MTVAVVLSSISVVVAISSATVAVQSLRLARRSASLPVLVGLLAEYHSAAFKNDGRWVRDELRQRTFPELTAEEQGHAAAVAHFYDNIGLLVATGVAAEQPLRAFLGDAAQERFRDLWPLIKEVRQRQGDYQEYFEDFVARTLESSPADARAKIRQIPEAEWHRFRRGKVASSSDEARS
jgi:hypothetical protein